MKYTYCPPTNIDISKEDQFIFLTRKNSFNEEEIVVYNRRLVSFFFSIDHKIVKEMNGDLNTQRVRIRVDGTNVPIFDINVTLLPISVNFNIGTTSSRVTVRNDLFMFEIFFFVV
jgi:hypothetical protein